MTTDEFLAKARWTAAAYSNREYAVEGSNREAMVPEDLQVVWMSHVMGDKKVMLFNPNDSGVLFEVTLNTKDDELYLDVYKKKANVCVELDKSDTEATRASKTEKALRYNQSVVDKLFNEVFTGLFGNDKNRVEDYKTIKITRG